MPATKDEIAALFWRYVEHYGFGKTSVGEIARELGISKTTIYQHFKSKEDMLDYVIRNAATREAEQVEGEYASLPTYWARLEKLVRERVLQSTRDWLDRYQPTEARHQFELGALVFGQVYSKLIERWAVAGAAAGEFQLVGGDAALTQRLAGSMIQWAIRETRANRGHPVDEYLVEAIRKLLA